MRAIDIKTPAPKTPAAKPSTSEATSSRTTKSAPAAETGALLAGIVEALLQFVGAHRVERIGSVA